MTTRVTTYTYDWRGRRVATDGEVDFYQETAYDNLDRPTVTQRRNTSSGGTLVAKSETKYDARGRGERCIRDVSGGELAGAGWGGVGCGAMGRRG